MPKFGKKPVVIEAWPARTLVKAATLDWDALPKQVIDAYEKGGWVFSTSGIHISTLEGTMFADLDDMVIKGVNGEFYPCKPDIFEKTYESA
jgi:hypothetical protein